MQANLVHLPSAPPEPTATPDPRVDIVVMAEDTGFVASVRESLGEGAQVWRARSTEESVDLLLAGRCGVLLIDMEALTTPPAPLIEQIVDQFPDVVVVVAARREEESALAGLVSEGLIYRLIHKPFTVKRAGMFLQAAMRAHLQRRDDPTTRPELPLTARLRARLASRRRLFVGAGVAAVLVIAATGYVLMRQDGTPRASRPAAQPPVAVDARGEPIPHETPTASTTTGTRGTVPRVTPPAADAHRTAASTRVVSTPPLASQTPATPAARAGAPHVYADPLAAVVVNEDDMPSSRAKSQRSGSGRSYGTPISSGHPTAGYVRRTATVATTSTATPASSAPVLAAQAPAPPPLLPDSDLLRTATAEPAYPPEAFRNRIEGWVEVEFTVDVSGAPRDIAVAAAEPAGVFDAAAIGAVADWRYRPRVVNGRPVPQRTSVTLRFNVAD